MKRPPRSLRSPYHGRTCMPGRLGRRLPARRRWLASGLAPEGAECRSSKSACADLDGKRASGVSPLARQYVRAAGRY